MLIRRTMAVLSSVLIITLLTGCWDYVDLKDIQIPIVDAFDRNPEGSEENKMIVTRILPALERNTANSEDIDPIVAKNLGQSREFFSRYSAEIMYPGLLQGVIMGEELARGGLAEYTDILFRYSHIKTYIPIAIAEGLGKDILKMAPPENIKNQGEFIINLIASTNKEGFFPSATLHSFAVDYISAGRNPVMPVLKVKNGEEVIIGGTGIFKKDKLIKIIDMEETRSLIFLRGVERHGYIPFEVFKDGSLQDKGTLYASNKRKVKVSRKGKDFNFEIKIALAAGLFEHISKVDLSENPELQKSIEEIVKSRIEEECREFVKKMQKEIKVDCIDITKYALAKWRNELEPIVDNDFLENVKISVEVEVKIENTGELF